jgi:hypothetical protein
MNSAGIFLNGYAQINGEASLQSAIANIGPISVALVVTPNFQSYRSGIFVDNTCTGALNHGKY